jgi:hypothetical protein
MINKFLNSIISTFSDEDWKDYKNYIKSSDKISGRRYFPIVNALSKYNKEMDRIKKMSAEKIFRKAFGKSYTSQTLLNRQTELLGLTKEFLITNAFKKNDLYGLSTYHSELVNRKIHNLYSKETKKIKGLIDENIHNEDSYKYLRDIVLTNATYYQNKNNKLSIDLFYSHSKYMLADILCNLFKIGKVFQMFKYKGSEYDFNPIIQFIESIAAEKLLESLEKQDDKLFIIPLIRYYAYKSMQNPDDPKSIAKAMKLFFTNERNFSKYFQTEMYRLFTSYYIVKANKGNPDYHKILFKLYKKKLDNNLTSDLSLYTYPTNVFREYIVTGIKVKQYKWVMHVINNYSRYLPDDIRDDEMNLASIRLCFSKKEYENVQELVQNHKGRNILHQLDSMCYKLMSLFELRNFEAVYFEIDRAKHFIKYNKSKIPIVNREYFDRFLNKVMIIINYYTNPYNKDTEMLFFEINNDKSLYMMKEWIHSKVDEFKKNTIY